LLTFFYKTEKGRMVADNIHGMKRKYKGTYGASVVRLFRNVAACVGMNEKMLQSKGLSFESVHVHPGSHAGYFPGAKSINFKLTFDPTSGKIWGAQAIGEDGVERRIDIISTAMQGNLTVEDLANLELCYAPPLGSAKDPVNMAGMVAQNIVEGLVTQVGSGTTRKMEDMLEDPFFFLDVRNPGEIEMKGTISDGPVINIPLNDLRDRLHELDKNSRYVLVCQSGQRAYYAYRILKQNGFDHISNLSGAFITHGHMSRRASAQN
jgi:rhodanese-related sulfurtransferase